MTGVSKKVQLLSIRIQKNQKSLKKSLKINNTRG